MKFNYKAQKYSLEQLHLSLVNSSWGQGQLLKIHGKREFVGEEIVAYDMKGFNFDPIEAKTIEISTRFHYNEETGMYLS